MRCEFMLYKQDGFRCVAIPTAGHTPGHLAVSVSLPNLEVLFAGDLSYTQEALLNDRLDGVAVNGRMAHQSLETLRCHVVLRPTVYLPAHDPESSTRLARQEFVYPRGGFEGSEEL